jgi:molybdenum cofactor cytidylyltransferase
MAETASCALVLLAAGGSSRMGRPKQLLPIGDRPLLRQVAEAAAGAPVTPVVVVLGAHAAEIRPCLDGLPVRVIVNDGWAEGMGSSVRAGMKALASFAPEASGVIIALTDQPDFSADHVSRLLDAHRRTGRSIVASQCGGKLMPPAFFAAVHFPALLALRGDAGARSLFQVHANEVAAVPAEELRDLDTQTDYAEYLKPATDRKSPPEPPGTGS